MFRRLAIAIAIAVLAAVPTAGLAADERVDLALLDEPIAAGTFDWDGFYAGVYGVTESDAGGLQGGVGVNLGINSRLEFVLVGAEIAVHGVTDGAASGVSAQAIGRVGVAATDEVVLFGAGGLGVDIGPAVGNTDVLVGGGVEFAVTDSVSLRGQYLREFDVGGANPADQISLGANFHF